MKRYWIMIVGAIMMLGACAPHFISDKGYRRQVETDFNNRKVLLDRCFGDDMDCIYNRQLPRQECEALQFLMAYMPYSDMADYDLEFYKRQVEYAFMARDTMPWGRLVPEDIFRHFVLVYRVNNENLDTARMVFYRALKERVRGLSMEEAALEVNHWCHEYVAYRGADARTSAPLATMRTSLGRCGEESTFAVTALRAVGIPARQCYTPRWAHCDDNHAWVEVWIASDDRGHGEWKFLGACEPDPRLDMGWFSVPSTRCLMVHSKAFGRYHGDEEVVVRTDLYSELNLLSHYAPTKHVTVLVQNAEGKPVEHATVKFKMYNYAEYYTLATYSTNADGTAGLTTGLGDLMVWATDGTNYDYAKLDVRTTDTIALRLWRQSGADYIDTFDIVPPVAGLAKTVPTDEETAKNAKRIAVEDSIRNAYVATFPTKERMWELIAPRKRSDLLEDQQQRLWEMVKKSEGNYREILDYIVNDGWHFEEFDDTYEYLCSYSDKDLRDITAEVLRCQRTYWDLSDEENYPEEVFKKGILPARISNEMVRPWRSELKEAMMGMADVDAVKRWTMEQIAVDDTGNYYNCPISPLGVYKLRCADPHSRDIFFVATCRALGFPAYLDNATNRIFVWKKGRWETVDFEGEKQPAAAVALTLTYRGKEPAVPVYYPHFTLQKYEDGDFVTFDFEEDERMAKFPASLELSPGYYCLSTGMRYPDGEVINRLEFFRLEEGKPVSKEIVLPSLQEQHHEAAALLYIHYGTNREPSKHLRKELAPFAERLNRWEGTVIRKEGEWDSLGADLVKRLGLSQLEFPLVAILDKEGNILFHSEGYQIGLAEQLMKLL